MESRSILENKIILQYDAEHFELRIENFSFLNAGRCVFAKKVLEYSSVDCVFHGTLSRKDIGEKHSLDGDSEIESPGLENGIEEGKELFVDYGNFYDGWDRS